MSSPDQLTFVMLAFSGMCVTPMLVCWPTYRSSFPDSIPKSRDVNATGSITTSARLDGMPSLPHATSLTVAGSASVWPALAQAAWISENLMVNV